MGRDGGWDETVEMVEMVVTAHISSGPDFSKVILLGTKCEDKVIILEG